MAWWTMIVTIALISLSSECVIASGHLGFNYGGVKMLPAPRPIASSYRQLTCLVNYKWEECQLMPTPDFLNFPYGDSKTSNQPHNIPYTPLIKVNRHTNVVLSPNLYHLVPKILHYNGQNRKNIMGTERRTPWFMKSTSTPNVMSKNAYYNLFQNQLRDQKLLNDGEVSLKYRQNNLLQKNSFYAGRKLKQLDISTKSYRPDFPVDHIEKKYMLRNMRPQIYSYSHDAAETNKNKHVSHFDKSSDTDDNMLPVTYTVEPPNDNFSTANNYYKYSNNVDENVGKPYNMESIANTINYSINNTFEVTKDYDVNYEHYPQIFVGDRRKLSGKVEELSQAQEKNNYSLLTEQYNNSKSTDETVNILTPITTDANPKNTDSSIFCKRKIPEGRQEVLDEQRKQNLLDTFYYALDKLERKFYYVSISKYKIAL